MKIAIIGSGGVGGYFGARLAAAGNDVTFVARGAHLNEEGLLRAMKGHFAQDHHFGFEAAAWYWHFVDVVWLGLFIFVYVY